jgi:hypothetical protein
LLPLTLIPALWACGPNDLLGPDAAQGVEGVVLLGPVCPVQTPDNPCPDQPYEALIRIRDESHHLVTRVRSGDDGRFRVGLRPGRYTLDPESGTPFPTAQDVEVEVVGGSYAEVTIHYDSGIR